MASEWFQRRLMESYRSGKQRPLMDALTSMMAEGLFTLCAKCQSDRLVCALRPLCGDRKYTSLLADMGADEKEIRKTHDFCFSSHLNRLKDIKLRKEPFSSVKDAKYPLSPFVATVSGSSQEEASMVSDALSQSDPKKAEELLASILAQGWGKLISVNDGDRFVIYGNKNGVIQIDLQGKVATLNPDMELIRDAAHFRSVFSLLSTLSFAVLKVEKEDVVPAKFVYTFEIPAGQQKGFVWDEFSKLSEKMQEAGITSTVVHPTEENLIKLVIDASAPASRQCRYDMDFAYADVRRMISVLSETAGKRSTR